MKQKATFRRKEEEESEEERLSLGRRLEPQAILETCQMKRWQETDQF